ncbi:MAG: alpha/beta fold hydrolase, partial [Halobacteriota archaeon]
AGYSMGGAVVLRYMLGSHEPVDKLVLVSTTGPCMHARLPSLFETLRLWETCIGLGAFVKLLEHFNKDVVLERFINSAYPHILKLDDEALRTDLLEWIEGMFKKADHQAFISGLLQMQKRDLTPGVSAILKPTRICHGEDDPFVPYALAQYQQRLMPAELTGFEMTGHGIFFEPKRNLLNEKLAW